MGANGGREQKKTAVLAALLGHVAGAASGHRGAKSWQALVDLVESAPVQRPPVDDGSGSGVAPGPAGAPAAETGPALLTVLRQAPHDPAGARKLARWLLGTAAADPRFQADFTRWRNSLRRVEESLRTPPVRPDGTPSAVTPPQTPVIPPVPVAPAGHGAALPTWVRWCVVAGLATVVFVVVVWIAGALVLPSLLKDSADRWVVASSLGVAVTAVVAAWGPVLTGAGDHDTAREPLPAVPYSWPPDSGAAGDRPGAVSPGGIQLSGAGGGNQVVITGNRTTVSFGLQSRALVAVVVLALAVAGTTTFVSIRYPHSTDGGAGQTSPQSEGAKTVSGPLTATTIIGSLQTSTRHYYWPRSEASLSSALAAGHAVPAEPGISELDDTITITLQTAGDEAVLIKAIRVVRLRRGTAPQAGLFVDVPCEGCGAQAVPRLFSTRLDDQIPTVVPEASETPGAYYYVTAGSPEEFQVDVVTHHCDCTFDLALDWIDQGVDRSTVLNNGGLHFHTLGSDALSWYRDFSPGGTASVLVPQAAPTDPATQSAPGQ